ncbi:hypothetical protein [Lysobacter sp. Hz 25]|uniref:hypothetical protein n=1 Tax=Lysobacter sp. Hz 25 TaxID=3383698 RepID=UPI0038D43B49
MPTLNPYEAPQSAFGVTDQDDLTGPWRDGTDLVVRPDARLPPRCIKCNAPASAIKRRRYYWHSGAYYLLILLSVLVYVIVAMLVRKNTHLSSGLCERHGRRRVLGMSAAIVLFLASFSAFVVALAEGSKPELFLFAILALPVSIAAGLSARLVYPRRIGERYARFRGCGPAFLETLPRFSGRDH